MSQSRQTCLGKGCNRGTRCFARILRASPYHGRICWPSFAGELPGQLLGTGVELGSPALHGHLAGLGGVLSIHAAFALPEVHLRREVRDCLVAAPLEHSHVVRPRSLLGIIKVVQVLDLQGSSFLICSSRVESPPRRPLSACLVT